MKHHHNITPMKHIFYCLLLTLVLSCDTAVKESQSLTDLKAKKTDLIEQMDRIGTELKDVEMAISELRYPEKTDDRDVL